MSDDITNTSKLSSAAKLALAATPGGIIEQESQGQDQLVQSTQLPVQGLLGEDRVRWEAIGVTILDDGHYDGKADDPLFCHVVLPTGWKKVATDHPLWTNLVDEAGYTRAKICYKAAFYDRHAHVTLNDCVCADCGHEQSTMHPCTACGSRRVVTQIVAKELFGANWRDAFKEAT